MGVKRHSMALIAAALAIGLTAPLAAQSIRSDGFKFLEAVRKRDVDTVVTLLGQPGNTLVNSRELTSGQGILHITVERRDLAWLKFFLQRGANPNMADNKGKTPLQLAATSGFVEGVDALVNGGAQVDVADRTGETPLIAAVHRRDLATVRILLAKKSNPDRTDNSGRSARHYAELMGATPILEAIAVADKARASTAPTYGPN